MMGTLWVVFFVALTGAQLGYGLPVGSTPQTYPHDSNDAENGWSSHGVYATVPALLVVITAVSLLFGCTWCYRHKDCKPNEGADNQLFTASAAHLHEARRSQPPDSGFSEPSNNNISEDNNNGPISLREMQNIANNNAAAYIISENEERNRVSRQSVVEFEPLPTGLRVVDPLEPCADWFGGDDFPRNRLQYLREMANGWFGRVVQGEIEDAGVMRPVAVHILRQGASLVEKTRFLNEARLYRDMRHENILTFIAKHLQEEPWILIYELCTMNLNQYLIANRPKMALLNERGVPLRLMCDVTAALAHMHARGFLYRELWTGSVLIRGEADAVRAVLGRHVTSSAPIAPPTPYSASGEVCSLGTLIWEVCAWGATPISLPLPPPDLPCPYRNHLYQVMQLCWNHDPEARPTAQQVHALLYHLFSTHTDTSEPRNEHADFEERWQRLKPNSIPKIDEHVAIIHAPSTSTSHFTSSDQELDTPTIQDTLSVDMDTAVSRSSSIMSDKDPLSIQIKSESLTNLHGSLDDVRNIYLTHNETATLECNQGNICFDDCRDKEHDRSDSSVSPWVKDIMAGSQDDVSYYKDVSDVIKNLDNILNSEKTSSSESSHQASPSRDNLSLDCKDYPVQSSMVKSPGITNFQNLLDTSDVAISGSGNYENDETDQDTIGTLSHSFERHSDTTSQQTLENITPDTPNKDMDSVFVVENQVNAIQSDIGDFIVIEESPLQCDDVLLKTGVFNSEIDIPKLKELCVASISSVSKINESNLRKDCECEVPCDNIVTEVRTENKEATKSIDDIGKPIENENPPHVVSTNEVVEQVFMECTEILPKSAQENVSCGMHYIPTKIEDCDKEQKIETDTVIDQTDYNEVPKTVEHIKIGTQPYGDENAKVIFGDIKQEVHVIDDVNDISLLSTEENNISKVIDTVFDKKYLGHVELITCVAPEAVQSISNSEKGLPTELSGNKSTLEFDVEDQDTNPRFKDTGPTETLSPEIVQNIFKHDLDMQEQKVDTHNDLCRSDIEAKELKDTDSSVYMDLINTTSEIENSLDSNVKEVIQSCLESSEIVTPISLVRTDSTVYLDLPSFIMIKETDNFLHMERTISSNNIEAVISSSTPKTLDTSSDKDNTTLETVTKEEETQLLLSETKLPDSGPGLSKYEQKCVPDSPFDSPTKSHHTDTFDENSSVVLGPFENLTELYKGGAKYHIDLIDIPKEEILAFSSNFSEINLETPSPLRDGNFLNEVPDIVTDEMSSANFDDIATVSEEKPELSEPSENTEDVTEQSITEKHVSPSTPPNSPGIFQASTSQQKYVVDINLSSPRDPEYSLQKEIELNEIELQITSKLAMAENENNMNIEYSGPLTVEGIVSDDVNGESDAIPESFLAGNGGAVENVAEGLTLDEECVQALRNELELKLPLAQVAGIEPAGEWSELPPPPELVLSYPGALSPIAEETRQQLSAYEHDHWNQSVRTESSESYPEPCNNSTEEATEPPRDHSTYTLHSRHSHTYTVNKEVGSSKEITMSADSLNASPYKKPQQVDMLSPVNDTTYVKDEDEKESNCEKISQVSPFMLSPTTETSVPESSDNADNGTGVSTLSKTTLPTDAKLSKPSETQCLSKATSIDSWCSNDTLYNVEENFDDLDPEQGFEPEKCHSDSGDTLTHNEEEKDQSNCSTYIIHDSKSEVCDTFSPDSITANDNNTYTKAKTEAAQTTPSLVTKSEINDSTKNSHTKDLAYGTLMSSLPSYSNCTTEVISGMDDIWKLPQPELVRKSPIPFDVDVTPPNIMKDKEYFENNPNLNAEPCIKKMDSVEITCLQDESIGNNGETGNLESYELVIPKTSPNSNYMKMTPSVTSTPITDVCIEADNIESVPMHMPKNMSTSPEYTTNILNFQIFQQSAEVRPQDLSTNVSHGSPNQDTDLLLEVESQTLSNKDSSIVTQQTPTYFDFEYSALSKPQEFHSKSSQSMESGVSTEEFRQFECSIRNRPQDLSSLIDASSLLLRSERQSSELAMSSSLTVDCNLTSQLDSRIRSTELTQSLELSPPNVTNLIESQSIINVSEPTNNFLINLHEEEETEQPHSIIITEVPLDKFNESPNKTYDSHVEAQTKDLSHTLNSFDSHKGRLTLCSLNESSLSNVNGIDKENEVLDDLMEQKSPTIESNGELSEVQLNSIVNESRTENINFPNSLLYHGVKPEETKCNGNSENFATVNFLNETFEELVESNVDDSDIKDLKLNDNMQDKESVANQLEDTRDSKDVKNDDEEEILEVKTNGVVDDSKVTSVTEDFLQNEKKFCQLDSYFPMLNDIRFTGPAAEIMSTSFTQDSPTEPTSPECEQDNKPDTAADLLKEWDTESDSHSTNSSSGEFIWKHRSGAADGAADHSRQSGASEGSGDSGSGSEGDEVEFVPSSWDCRAAPSKSSLRSLETTPDSKKRVVFKRQKYHCVYEYPREAAGLEPRSPAFLPDLSTYTEWDSAASYAAAELGYGQLFGAPSALDLYPLRAATGADYDEDFYISSSARPFESLGVMSTGSQFFPGKPFLERTLPDPLDEFPAPPSPLPQTRTPSLDLITPDSGVEDLTPGSGGDAEPWRPDSTSSSESVSPGAGAGAGGEALGGLRHTRDRLKLDLPPSPRAPSPRHARVFSFALEKPPRAPAPLVMTDDTPDPAAGVPAPLPHDHHSPPPPPPPPEPTFSTFGKTIHKIEPEQKIILTDEPDAADPEQSAESPKVVEPVKGEGTVLDSGDEDSGIESSSKATLDRNKAPNVS